MTITVPPRMFTVVIDTREKPHNQLFEEGSAPKGDDPICMYVKRKVDTGDYIIQEAPKLVCIEKKQDGKELYTNLMRDRERFMKELSRMQEYTHKWIVFQQTYEDFCDPRNWVGVKDPKRGMAIVEGWLMALIKQDIHFIFAGDQAARWVKRLMTKKYDDERKRLRNALKESNN